DDCSRIGVFSCFRLTTISRSDSLQSNDHIKIKRPVVKLELDFPNLDRAFILLHARILYCESKYVRGAQFDDILMDGGFEFPPAGFLSIHNRCESIWVYFVNDVF